MVSRAWRKEGMGMTANWQRFSFWWDEDVLELIMVVVT